MPIDFHAPANALSYVGRAVDADWATAMRGIVDPAGLRVADIGCGGGLYSLAWAELGAAEVVGVDFSAAMVETASQAVAGHANGTVQLGEAGATGLADAAFDLVFERALIHHLDDLPAAFAEVRRILRPGGRLIVQDRTMQDVALPGSAEHIRGWFFEIYPRLLAVETARRPESSTVLAAMTAAGLVEDRSFALWETRRLHDGRDALASDLRARTGRSLLHDLDDAELDRLAASIIRRLPSRGTIRERDRWTVWTAVKPHGADGSAAI